MTTEETGITKNDLERVILKIEKIEYLATAIDVKIDRLEKGYDKLDSRLWTSFFIIVAAILGLYGTIVFGLFFKH
jgi:hypothetical protein